MLWSHLTGWCARSDTDIRVLAVDDLAAPELVADIALHLAADGLHCEWTPSAEQARWEHADALDAALALFEEKGGTTW